MRISKRNKRKILVLLVFSFLFYWCFPSRLFDLPYSTVLNDEKGELLAAKIASDGQWRFPEVDSVPIKLEQCILHFEDEYFHYHPGVNPISTFRALYQNIKAGSVVSGGSTISMQLIRLSRKNPSRSYWEKIKELYLAVRLEFSYSKEEILRFYVSHAPYGGNVVGAETAAWRYFNRPLHQLSWAEYATLAVLPNSPSLIRPGKNMDELMAKRNRLLSKLQEKEVISKEVYELAILEPLPGKPHKLPDDAYHLLSYSVKQGKEGERIQSTLDFSLQQKVLKQVNSYVKYLENNQIKNACALVIDLESGEVKSYVGNANYKGANAAYVDLIQANRSSGSILKPFLYAAGIEEGMIHNSTLLKDIPISISGFSPSNFNKSFEGVVRAEDALARSLNIPATNLLKDFGVAKFYTKLKDIGLTSLHRSPDNYGLSLILGGAEVNLWDVANAYANQTRRLNAFFSDQAESNAVKLWKGSEDKEAGEAFNEGTWYMISRALKNVQRPGLEESWRRFSSSRKVAWKTGTSFGLRDAWAVGYDAKYLVAVWVGNAEGEGRPGLTGVSVAAPLMFNIFQELVERKWIGKPLADLRIIKLCESSGLSPTQFCPTIETEISAVAKSLPPCNYHKKIQLNERGERVTNQCDTPGKITDTTWFYLSPVEAYYYKDFHRNYRDLPPFDKNCVGTEKGELAIIYPQNNTQLIIPKNFEGEFESVLLEATHRDRSETLYWHLDDDFLGSTTMNHSLKTYLSPGKHQLSVMDTKGRSYSVNFKAY